MLRVLSETPCDALFWAHAHPTNHERACAVGRLNPRCAIRKVAMVNSNLVIRSSACTLPVDLRVVCGTLTLTYPLREDLV